MYILFLLFKDGMPSFQDMRLFGLTKKGLPMQSFAGVHPEVLDMYYGATHIKEIRPANATGAGHPPDEGMEWEDEDNDNESTLSSSSSGSTISNASMAELRNAITQNLKTNIKHNQLRFHIFQIHLKVALKQGRMSFWALLPS